MAEGGRLGKGLVIGKGQVELERAEWVGEGWGSSYQLRYEFTMHDSLFAKETRSNFCFILLF